MRKYKRINVIYLKGGRNNTVFSGKQHGYPVTRALKHAHIL